MNISRRGFLAGAACAVVLRGKRSFAAAGDDRFRIGVQSYTLRSYSTEDAIRHAGEIGFAGIEFFDRHFSIDSSDERIDEVKKLASAAKLKIAGHGVNGLSSNHEKNRKVFEFAKRAGIRNIVADPTEDSFDSLDKLVAEFDIRVAIHNHGPNARYNRIVDVVKAVEDHHPLIGACADLGHYIRSGEDPVEAIRVFDKRLFGIHLKDFDAPKGDAKGVILGKGKLQVDEVFRALARVNFPQDGALSLEYEENAGNPLADITECLAVAREAARKATA